MGLAGATRQRPGQNQGAHSELHPGPQRPGCEQWCLPARVAIEKPRLAGGRNSRDKGEVIPTNAAIYARWFWHRSHPRMLAAAVSRRACLRMALGRGGMTRAHEPNHAILHYYAY